MNRHYPFSVTRPRLRRTPNLPLAALGAMLVASAVAVACDAEPPAAEPLTGSFGSELGVSGAKPAVADYDGDGKADIALQTAGGRFFVNFAANGFQSGWDATYGNPTHYPAVDWGHFASVPTPADYDGDGKADLSMKTDGGEWYIDYSRDGFRRWDVRFHDFGPATSRPAPADYDGDGKADLAVKDAAGYLRIDYSADGFGAFNNVYGPLYGDDTAQPAAADYDGDGKADIAVKFATGEWRLDYARDGFGAWNARYGGYGAAASKVAPADYDGDRKADVSALSDDGTWHIDHAADGYGSWNAQHAFARSQGYRPVPADYDGDGKADMATMSSTGAFRIDYTSTNGVGTYDGTVETRACGNVACRQIAPELTPELPASAKLYIPPTNIVDAYQKCDEGGGFKDAQWVTPQPFLGKESYELLEGTVLDSKVPRDDNPLNHITKDWDVFVRPDPVHSRLLSKTGNTSGSVEVEWEQGEFPVRFFPSKGDRVSVIGFHVLDCGHADNDVQGSFRAEIHPPVLFATHRMRPIHIPDAATFDFDNDSVANERLGSNVWVPGVATDVWVNRNSGEMADGDCDFTDLHQPYGRGCIRGPHDIRREFSFNVYLPTSPRTLVRGRTGDIAENPPIYFGIEPLPGEGALTSPAPRIERVTEGDVTYLRVTVDLRNFTGDKWAQRIVAGWVYPDPANFGLRRWTLFTDYLESHTDHDDTSDGDWHVWFNTNNGAREWSKIISCSNCVDGREKLKPSEREWNAGSTGRDGRVWDDVILFPGATIAARAVGYDADNGWGSAVDLLRGNGIDDMLGVIDANLPQQAGTHALPSTGRGGGSMTLGLRVQEGRPIGPAILTPHAIKLREHLLVP